jgi:hypothetical protein
VRTRLPISLDSDTVPEAAVATGAHQERGLRARELDARFTRALRTLPVEDAAVLRLVFVQGWSLTEVRRGLGVEDLDAARLRMILNTFKTALDREGVGVRDAAASGLSFLEDRSS